MPIYTEAVIRELKQKDPKNNKKYDYILKLMERENKSAIDIPMSVFETIGKHKTKN